jgi:hypothetical protein
LPDILVKKHRRTVKSAGFVTDLSYPDNCLVRADESFVKTWLVANIGDVAWRGCYLECIDDLPRYVGLPVGLKPASERVLITETPVGETIAISVAFTAPTLPGCVISYWKLVDENGNDLMMDGYLLHCLVQVVSVSCNKHECD